jgi:adenylate cyclase
VRRGSRAFGWIPRLPVRTVLFLAVGLGVTALGLVAYGTDVLRNVELDSVDARFSIRGTQKPPSELIVVQIDDVTFNELHQRWPFSRTVHADAIRHISADHPKAIAYDVQFTEPSNGKDWDNPPDNALGDAIAKANGRVVLSTTEVDDKGGTAILGGDDYLRQIGAHPGNGLFPNDPGGVIRRSAYAIDKLKAFSVVTTEVADGHPVKPKLFGGQSAWIDYYGPPGTVRTVSFSRVAQGKTPRGLFRNKIVVVGPSAPSLQDVHPTSTTGNGLMSGAEIQANAIETVRRGLPLQPAPGGVNVALIVLLGLVAPLASLWLLSPLRAIALSLVAGAVFVVAAQLAFNGGRIVSFVYPLGTVLLASFGALAVHYVTTAFDRERVRDMFSRFVPEDVVDEVLASTDAGLRLGGVQRDGTVMFSDLRGFTSFAESLAPAEVIEVLNKYLSEMSDAILDHGGTLVAYMGDGIMAVFGAPIEQDDHADRALAAAREMLDVRLPRFSAWLREKGLSEGFRMGIGLNSGRVMSGNVGSERRVEYTAIGDTTNTAARLEGMTKGTPHQLFVADSTRSRLKEPPPDLVFVDEFEVRGRQARVKLWSVPDKDEAVPAPSGVGGRTGAEAE